MMPDATIPIDPRLIRRLLEYIDSYGGSPWNWLRDPEFKKLIDPNVFRVCLRWMVDSGYVIGPFSRLTMDAVFFVTDRGRRFIEGVATDA